MACETLSLGRLTPCKVVGGLKNLYLANFDEGLYSGMTLSADEEITAFDSLLTLLKYELKGANSFDETNEATDDTSFWTGAGTFVLKSQDIVTRKELKLASYGRPFVITEDYNGNFKLYGAQNGCTVSVGTASGAAMGDFQGYNVTISCSEKEPAFFVDSSIIGDATNTSITVGV